MTEIPAAETCRLIVAAVDADQLLLAAHVHADFEPLERERSDAVNAARRALRDGGRSNALMVWRMSSGDMDLLTARG